MEISAQGDPMPPVSRVPETAPESTGGGGGPSFGTFVNFWIGLGFIERCWDNSGGLRLCCALWRLYAYGKSFFTSNIKLTKLKLPMIQAINFLRCVPIVSSLLALPGISDVCDSIVASGQA